MTPGRQHSPLDPSPRQRWIHLLAPKIPPQQVRIQFPPLPRRLEDGLLRLFTPHLSWSAMWQLGEAYSGWSIVSLKKTTLLDEIHKGLRTEISPERIKIRVRRGRTRLIRRTGSRIMGPNRIVKKWLGNLGGRPHSLD